MSEWRPEGMLTSVEAVEKVIDYDSKPIRGNTRAGFLDGYERAERAMLAALRPLVNEDPCGCCGGHHPPIIPGEE